MPPRRTRGRTTLEWIRQRYEETEKKCPECGYVDKEGNWTSQTDGGQIVYRHVCPSCSASRDHTFTLSR